MLSDKERTKEQLVNELAGLRQRVAELEALEGKRKQAEIPLLGSEEYQRLFELSPMGITVLDMKGVITTCNSAVYMKSGYSKDDFIGKHFSKVATIRARDIPKFIKIFASLIRGKVPKPLEAMYTRKDGTTGWTEAHISLMKSSGKRISIQVIQNDITERKQAEEALRDALQRQKVIFEQAAESIVLVDVNTGKLVDFNEAAHMSLGYSREEFAKLGIPDFEVVETTEEVTKHIEKIVKEGADTFETQHRAKSGEIRNIDVSSKSIQIGGKTYAQSIWRDITERKQAAEELRKFKTVSDKAGYGVAMSDLEGNLSYVNDSFAGMHGYASDELIGKHLSVFHSEEQMGNVNRLAERLRQTGKYVAEEVWHKRKDNSVFPTLMNGTLVKSENEIPLFMAATVIDITERKQAEEEIRSLAKFPSENPNPVMRVAQNGTVLYANQSALPLLNEWRCQIGQLVPDYWHKFISQVLNSGLKKDAEVELGNRLFSLMFAPVVDAGYVNLYGLDITERKQAEEELKLRAQLLDAANDAIFVHTMDGNIIYVNENAYIARGYSRDELMNLNLYSIVVDAGSINRKLKELKEKGRAVFESAHIRKDGSVFPIEVQAQVVQTEKETLIFSIARDITERRQAEDRERELQQELNVSMRLAAIGELAAGVAHEINNPLTGVLGFSERLLRKSTDEEVRQDLERIHSEAQRMVKVMDNLRTFTRRREPEKHYSDINGILHETLELRAYELSTGNIEIVTDFAPSLPEVEVDFHQIQEVFLNIILNAEQVMTEAHSGDKLTIKTGKIKNHVRISFTDDGPGIPAEHLNKVFDPFFTTREEKGGTGLGLSVCHSIVTGHGGRLYARSKPGQGAAFFVELPCS